MAIICEDDFYGGGIELPTGYEWAEVTTISKLLKYFYHMDHSHAQWIFLDTNGRVSLNEAIRWISIARNNVLTMINDRHRMESLDTSYIKPEDLVRVGRH